VVTNILDFNAEDIFWRISLSGTRAESCRYTPMFFPRAPLHNFCKSFPPGHLTSANREYIYRVCAGTLPLRASEAAHCKNFHAVRETYPKPYSECLSPENTDETKSTAPPNEARYPHSRAIGNNKRQPKCAGMISAH
jgi:hypothetical protein